MNLKDILNKLPGNWSELTLRDYIKLSPVISDEPESELIDPDIITINILSELDKNIQIISLLSDSEVDVIEQLTMVQLNELVTKISFISELPSTVKPTIKYKQFSELSYDNFITFQKLNLDFTPDSILSNAVQNLPTMLSVFSQDNKDPEYFLDQSMPEVLAGFFIVISNTKKYLKRTEASLYKLMMITQWKQLTKILTLLLMKLNPFKKSSLKSGTTG